MDEKTLKDYLARIKDGTLSVDEAFTVLKDLPFQDIGFACIDHHRALRKGFPEVIWGEGKTADQIIEIISNMNLKNSPVLATRVDSDKAKKITPRFPESKYYPLSRVLTVTKGNIEEKGIGTILVVTAGTSDIPVAEEAAVTAEIMGNRVDCLYDTGVAGIHRLFSHKEKLLQANVLVVVAGMEGALPSVVGGFVSRPVIAVPTSAGYGASFGGLAALLGMLNSCAAGVSVVNIDNGFGAGYMASLINRSAISCPPTVKP